jgi:threonine dehydrogenase-like Zn-dependent dehydrogenase
MLLFISRGGKKLKARAMVLEEFNKELVYREIEVPELKNGQILVEILASGVCGSDVHMYEGRDPRTPLPIILGHEGVGRILRIDGEKESVNKVKLKKGDKIIWNRGNSCGECYYCKVKESPSLCPDRWTYGISNSIETPPYLNGCYADKIILESSTNIFKVSENIDPAVLVTASCSGATSAHAFDYINTEMGDSVLIQGPGPLGIFAAYYAYRHGAEKIFMIGGTEERLEMAKKFGVTKTINRHKYSIEERKEIILESTHGRGVDYAVEAVGHPAAVREGLALVRTGGSYLSVGFGEPNGKIELDCFTDIVRKNLNYQGVWVSDTKHTNQAVEAILGNPELFAEMITHRFKLEEANQALKVISERNAVKAVIEPQSD